MCTHFNWNACNIEFLVFIPEYFPWTQTSFCMLFSVPFVLIFSILFLKTFHFHLLQHTNAISFYKGNVLYNFIILSINYIALSLILSAHMTPSILPNFKISNTGVFFKALNFRIWGSTISLIKRNKQQKLK